MRSTFSFRRLPEPPSWRLRPPSPATSGPSLPSSCCFGLVKQLLSDPAFPPLCHPRSRAARSPARAPGGSRARHRQVLLWAGPGGPFTPREARRCWCGALTSQFVVPNQSGSVSDSLRFPGIRCCGVSWTLFEIFFCVRACVEF